MVSANVAKLKLPRSMSRTTTFNIDVLSHYVDYPSRLQTRTISKSSRIIIDKESGGTMYIIGQLLRKCQFDRKREWIVTWHELPDHDVTWERERAILHVSHWNVLITDFTKRQREVKSGGCNSVPCHRLMVTMGVKHWSAYIHCTI